MVREPFNRRRRMAKIDPRIPREPGRTLGPERRLRGLVEIEDEDPDDSGGAAAGTLGRLGRRLGPKGRFLVAATVIGAGITLASIYWDRFSSESATAADHTNPAQVGLGMTLYDQHCAFCHGDALQGQPGWDGEHPDGGRPALPLDGTAPTWRLSDRDLFDVVKFGGQPFSPPAYKNDMPAFEGRLADADIWAILAYVKSHWSAETHERQREAIEAQRN